MLSASEGPFAKTGALYRRPLGETGRWERITDFVDGNIDSQWLSARGDRVAYASETGDVFISTDVGSTWQQVASELGRPTGVALA